MMSTATDWTPAARRPGCCASDDAFESASAESAKNTTPRVTVGGSGTAVGGGTVATAAGHCQLLQPAAAQQCRSHDAACSPKLR